MVSDIPSKKKTPKLTGSKQVKLKCVCLVLHWEQYSLLTADEVIFLKKFSDFHLFWKMSVSISGESEALVGAGMGDVFYNCIFIEFSLSIECGMNEKYVYITMLYSRTLSK